MVKGGLSRSMLRIHDHKLLRAVTKIVAIPKTRVLLKPMRGYLRLIYTSFRSSNPATPSLRSAVHSIGGRIVFFGGPNPDDRQGRERQHQKHCSPGAERPSATDFGIFVFHFASS